MKARGEQLSGQPSLAYDELRLGRATRDTYQAQNNWTRNECQWSAYARFASFGETAFARGTAR